MTDYVITYRLVKGSKLTKVEGDANLHNFDDRLTDLESLTSSLSPFSSAYISTAGELHLVKASSEDINAGALPVAETFNELFTGPWQPSTFYAANKLFTAKGRLWAVLINHTSDTTFVGTANDGLGHDYYRELIDFTSIDGEPDPG